MIRRRTGVLLLAAFLPAACAESPARPPGACKIAHVATLPLLPGNFVAVEGALNRKPAVLMLDTGAEGSAVADWAVGQLRLERVRRAPVHVSGIGGVAMVEVASARVGLGGDETWRELPVLDLPFVAGRPVAGLVGMNVLARYDLEVSFPEKRVRLWETQDCAGRYPLWGGHYWSEPLTVSEWGRPMLTLSVQDRPVSAMLDTGASNTTIGRDAALGLGVPAASLDADPAGRTSGADGAEIPLRVHRFAGVGVGPERYDNQRIAVAPMRRIGAEMLLGVDWMRNRRIWISWRNKRLFVQPAAAIAPPAPGSAAAAFP